MKKKQKMVEKKMREQVIQVGSEPDEEQSSGDSGVNAEMKNSNNNSSASLTHEEVVVDVHLDKGQQLPATPVIQPQQLVCKNCFSLKQHFQQTANNETAAALYGLLNSLFGNGQQLATHQSQSPFGLFILKIN